jgi:hypothetical protein
MALDADLVKLFSYSVRIPTMQPPDPGNLKLEAGFKGSPCPNEEI